MTPQTLTSVLLSMQSILALAPLRREHSQVLNLVKSHVNLQSAVLAHAAYLVHFGPHRPGLSDTKSYQESCAASELFLQAVAAHFQTFFKKIKVPALLAANGEVWARGPYLAMPAAESTDALEHHTKATLALLDSAPKLYFANQSARTLYQAWVGHLEPTLSTVARNATWLPWLMVMGLPADAGTSLLAHRFLSTFGSGAGQMNLSENFKKLLTPPAPTVPASPKGASRPTAVGNPYYRTLVVLDPTQVLANPLVAEQLMRITADTRDLSEQVQQAVATALAQAFAPKEVTTTPAETAGDAVAQLAVALENCYPDQKLKAQEALRALGPLLAVVKENPELLALA